MEWTTERRYRRYEDWSNDEIKQIKEKDGTISLAYSLPCRA